MGTKPDLSPDRRNVGYESDSKESEPEEEEINLKKKSGDFVKRDFCIFCCSRDIMLDHYLVTYLLHGAESFLRS